ncbi:MAG: carboxypeptidase-like regulatory domain-containing protein [Thermoplasmatota archaeon]
MKKIRSIGIVLVLLISSVLMAGVIAQDEQREPNVYGFVTDEENGGGVEAAVHFSGGPNVTVRVVSESGHFRVHLPPGSYVYKAEARGYQITRGELKVPRQNAINISISMAPLEEEEETSIHGVMYDEGIDTPVHGFVYLHNDHFETKVETDRSGSFKVQVRPGLYFWLAEARGYVSQRGKIEVPEEGVRLKIAMSPEEGEPEANLFGFMHVARTERPVRGTVTIWNENHQTMARSDENGKFQLLLRPGEYRWSAMARGFEPNRGTVEVSSEGTRLNIGMVPLKERFGVVTGRVMGPEEEPLPGSRVVFRRLMREDRSEYGEAGGVHGDPDIDESTPGMEPEGRPGEILFTAETNERGVFKIRLPFGAYRVIVHHPGFHPWKDTIRVTAEEPEIKMRIVLEPMEQEEVNRIKITMNKKDENSDGNFELIHFEADLDGDGVIDLSYHIVDRNSDGDPESVEWTIDMPPEMVERIMALLRYLMENGESWEDDDMFSPIPEEPYYPDRKDMPEWMDEKAQEGSENLPDPDDQERLDEGGTSGEETTSSDLPLDGSDTSEKGSSGNAEGKLETILAGSAVMVLIILGLIGSFWYIGKRR